MAVFRFCKMAAVRHLGFVVRLLGPPTVVFIAVQNFGVLIPQVSELQNPEPIVTKFGVHDYTSAI